MSNVLSILGLTALILCPLIAVGWSFYSGYLQRKREKDTGVISFFEEPWKKTSGGGYVGAPTDGGSDGGDGGGD